MAFGLTRARVSPIAIDFGSDSLKLLQVVPGEPPKIAAAGSVALPEAARRDPTARHAFYLNALKELLRTQPFKGRKAIVSIPAYQTLATQLQIPRSESADFDAQVGVHLRERLNIDPSRMVIRHYQVGQTVADGVTRQEVLCLAAGRDAIMRHVETAHRAKLDVVGMHAEPVTIVKAFSHMFRRADDSSHTTCFIDIGAATTKVVIAHGSEMVFAKNINAGGEHLIRFRANATGLSFDEARQLRIADLQQGGETSVKQAAPVAAAAESSEEGSGGSGALAMMNAAMAANRGSTATQRPVTPTAKPTSDVDCEAVDCLIEELQLCVRYHQSVFAERRIEKLVFLGGESKHTMLCQKIARALRIGAQLGDPLARLVKSNLGSKAPGLDLRQPQPGWAVPLGLCLSEANL